MNIISIKRVIVALIAIMCVCLPTPADTLMHQLFHVKDLMNQEKESDALTILRSIENQCLLSDNDSVKVLFNESMGYLLFEGHKYQECIPYLERVPALYEAINIKHRNYLEAYLGLGMAHQRLGHNDVAESFYRQGLLRSVSTPIAAEYQSSFYLNLGNLYKEKGDSLLTTECYKRIDAKQYGSLLDGTAEDLIFEGESLAHELCDRSEYEQALPIYDRLIERAKEIIGTHNDEYVGLLYLKASVLLVHLDRPADAIPIFEEIVDLSDYLVGVNETLLSAIELLSGAYRDVGKSEESIFVFDNLISQIVSRLGTANETYARAIGGKANALSNDLHRYDEAIPLLVEVINMSEILGPNSPSLLNAKELLALNYRESGKHEESLKLYGELLSYYSQDKSRYSKQYSRSLFQNGYVLSSLLKRYQEGLPLLAEVINIERGNPEFIFQIQAWVSYVLGLLDSNQLDKANSLIPQIDELFEMYQGNPTYIHLVMAMYNTIAAELIKSGSYKKGQSILENCMPKGLSLLEASDDIKQSLLHNYGRCLMLGGKYPEAVSYFEQSIAVPSEEGPYPKTVEYLEECKRHL